MLKALERLHVVFRVLKHYRGAECGIYAPLFFGHVARFTKVEIYR